MGKGGELPSGGTKKEPVNWEEVKKHTARDDKWLVIEGDVYDITEWSKRHPGGSRVISHYAGQDASEAFRAFHNDLGAVKKYLNPIHVAKLQDFQEEEVKEDVKKLVDTAQKMNLFKPSITFFVLNVGHLILLEALAYWILHYYGTGWFPWLVSIALFTTGQAQGGWVQHDFGHLSVCKNSFWNHALHEFTMSFLKGASSHWWNHMHYQHHAKPNVINKDPDVRLEKLFVLGETMPKQIAESKKKSHMPYNWQHRYFFIIGPPLLFPMYFQYMVFKHPITRGKWLDLCVMMLFYLRFIGLLLPLLGLKGLLLYYFVTRSLESHWFVWVSQSNHIPMEIDDDKERAWLPLQLHATCNVEKSFFNDWFTGHLNFQIEHHVFPTMPRHNLYKIAPYVKSLCEKHNIPYKVKPLGQAFRDVVQSLKHSGELWHCYYHAYHMS